MADPLQVVLYAGYPDVRRPPLVVNNETLGDLRFSSTDPGGFDACTLEIARPLGVEPEQLRAFAQLVVYDRRTGGVVFDGRLDQPGRSNQGGALRRLEAAGPARLVEDLSAPVMYVDQRTDHWEEVEKNLIGNGSAAADEDATAVDGAKLVYQVNEGAVLATNDRKVMRYRLLRETGQRLLRLRSDVRNQVAGGVTFRNDHVGRGLGVAGASADAVLLSQAPVTASTAMVSRLGTEFSSSHYGAEIRFIYIAGGTTLANRWWATHDDVIVLGERLDATGAGSGLGAGSNTVPAWEVVQDVVGRYLNPSGAWDGAAADISHSATYAIDQLVYDSPVTAAQVLADVLLLVPDFTWQGWERTFSGNSFGGHRFVFAPQPTAVDVVLDSAAGFDSPGGAADVWNQVDVRWQDRRGRDRRTRRSRTVDLLAGLTRRGQLDIGSQLGSAQQAQDIGDLWLAAHAAPTNSGTLTVAGPVWSRTLGRSIQPWEWRAGGLVQLRDTLPAGYGSASDSTRDGVSVWRVTGTDYSSQQGAVQLSLDDWGSTVRRRMRSLDKRLARLPRP